MFRRSGSGRSQGQQDMDTAAQVLALAQQTADQAIADAQQEAERIIARARQEAGGRRKVEISGLHLLNTNAFCEYSGPVFPTPVLVEG